MLYSPLIPRSLSLNTFPMGRSLIVFHLDMWCECEVTDSLIYQLFVSCFLMWNVSHDTFFFFFLLPLLFIYLFIIIFFKHDTCILDNHVRVNSLAPNLLHTSLHILYTFFNYTHTRKLVYIRVCIINITHHFIQMWKSMEIVKYKIIVA